MYIYVEVIQTLKSEASAEALHSLEIVYFNTITKQSVVIMQDGQEVNKIDVSNTVNDIKDKAEESGIIDKVKDGIKSGIDILKSIAPSDTKWPSDYMQEQTEQSTE